MSIFGNSSVETPNKNISYGTVDNVLSSNVLQVRIVGTDKNNSSDKLIDCVPLLPLFLNITPEIGQGVFVFHKDPTNPQSERYWIGPIHSREDKINGESSNSAESITPGGVTNTGVDINTIRGTKGLYSNEKEIAIQGRSNGDLIFKENETVLRINKFAGDNRLKFNKNNIGYIQLKSPVDLVKKIEEVENTEIIFTPPDYIIDVDIRTLDNNGSEVSEDSEDVVEYQIFIRKTASGKIINNLSSVEGSLEDSITFVTEKINLISKDDEKWQLFTNSPSVKELYNANYNYDGKQEIKRKVTVEKTTNSKKEKDSIINVVADRINLISHDGAHDYNLTNNESLIDDDTQKKIQLESQSMVYGEKLVEFLELLVKYVENHVHNYHAQPADTETSRNNVTDFVLESILNKNIKTH
tara:strand:+ start:3139 stop:4374 length:1236 start_codon:yes stop_codon:yes gene_type:complete